MIRASRTDPLLAFLVVVVVAGIYYGALVLTLPHFRFPQLAEMAGLSVAIATIYVAPAIVCALTQYALTKGIVAQKWWKVVQLVCASLLGPYIGASAAFAIWLAFGGKM